MNRGISTRNQELLGQLRRKGMEILSGHQQSRDDGQRVEGEAAHGRACSDLGSLEEPSGKMCGGGQGQQGRRQRDQNSQ